MPGDNRPIGIFDSGCGGLTVFKEIEKVMPQENIIYFGDTAHVPYGNKSKETIIKFSTNNILFLLRKRVKLVVIACNTASAQALDYLKGIFNIPILGVIEAGVVKALDVSESREIGIIGTRSTIASKSYEQEIFKRDCKVKVRSQACPLFVPMVEEGILSGPMINSALDLYLKGLKASKVDTIILGCTHYPLLKPAIANYLKDISIVDSAKEVALYTRAVLTERNLLAHGTKIGKRDFYLSDEPKGFVSLAKMFLKRDIRQPQVVEV